MSIFSSILNIGKPKPFKGNFSGTNQALSNMDNISSPNLYSPGSDLYKQASHRYGHNVARSSMNQSAAARNLAINGTAANEYNVHYFAIQSFLDMHKDGDNESQELSVQKQTIIDAHAKEYKPPKAPPSAPPVPPGPNAPPVPPDAPPSGEESQDEMPDDIKQELKRREAEEERLRNEMPDDIKQELKRREAEKKAEEEADAAREIKKYENLSDEEKEKLSKFNEQFFDEVEDETDDIKPTGKPPDKPTDTTTPEKPPEKTDKDNTR